MDVAMDTMEEIHLVAPLTLEQIGPQLDLALTELGININIHENLNKLREIQGVLVGSSLLDESVKQLMLNRIVDELNLQQVDCREFFLEELGKNEHVDNLILEV